MRVYFSGIGGVGIGPLAEIAADAGHTVLGSDLNPSPITQSLTDRGIEIAIGQDGEGLANAHQQHPIDWFVYTSALPSDHTELVRARSLGIRTSKRDEFLSEFIHQHNLKLIAIAGTHGKTTTTGLMIWACQQLGIPISYSIGSTISFGPSGHYDPDSQYFIYECDEYDRNFLHYSPHLSLITSLDYDHPDTYPAESDYRLAFVDFIEQSYRTILWQKDLCFLRTDPQADLESYDELLDLSHLTLAGDHVRHNAFLVEKALEKITDSVAEKVPSAITSALNSFPGTSRRFEKLADNLYSDYGHHPAEIKATLQLAREIAEPVVLVYQPHQNIRQHEIRDQYTDEVFADADTIYWLPTYLSREDPSLETLTQEQLTRQLTDNHRVIPSDLDDNLWQQISSHRHDGHLVLVMGAGSIDTWVRERLAT